MRQVTVDMHQKAWRKRYIFRLAFKVWREGELSSQVGRQRVPDSRSNVTKRTFAEGFQVCLWDFEQSRLCRRMKGTRWLRCAGKRRQVWRKSAVEVTESERCELVLNAVFNWEPMEFFQTPCNMITLRSFQDKPLGIVLDLLYARDLFIGYTFGSSIAVDQSWGDHWRNKFFSLELLDRNGQIDGCTVVYPIKMHYVGVFWSFQLPAVSVI